MPDMAQTFDVCIRGAGIVGRTLALLLARERLRVALLDSQSRQAALTEYQQANKALELDLLKAQASIEALRLAAVVATAAEATPDA